MVTISIFSCSLEAHYFAEQYFRHSPIELEPTVEFTPLLQRTLVASSAGMLPVSYKSENQNCFYEKKKSLELPFAH